MPAKPSGKIKVSTVRQKQKNGDIYIIERKTIYDTDKKYTKILSSKLISKIPKGSEIEVPTRQKRAKGSKSTSDSAIVKASRQHVGMMDILDHIGRVSGIDEALYSSTDTGTAQKIISIARYLVATKGQTLPGIYTWQFNHPIPYSAGITENIYHDLFVELGYDETLQQSFFARRCESLSEDDAIAYDSSTISSYSENQIEARYGFNKAGDGLKTIKYIALYSINSRQPIAFTKQPGNIPDVISIGNAINELKSLGVTAREVITDNGYYSEKNLAELLIVGFDFITLAKTSLKWIRPQIDKHREDLESFSTSCPFDHHTHGVAVLTSHTFEKTRKYANHKTGKNKGDVETFERRIYLHIFFNASNQAADRADFEADLHSIKTLVESGTAIEDLNETSQKRVSAYFTVRTWGNKTTLIPKEEAIKDAYRYHGYFVLVSNKERDAFEALKKYRKRATIESFFEAEKQYADGTRTRVWDTDTLRGRMFVQFVSLCYYEYLSEQIRQMKTRLEIEVISDDTSAGEKKLCNKLLSWLKNTPLYLQLQWFDTVEKVEISTELSKKRWNTETTLQDALYLKQLGVNLS